jgi:hypothetical protein
VAQGVEHTSSQLKALSSNPSTANKKKKKKTKTKKTKKKKKKKKKKKRQGSFIETGGCLWVLGQEFGGAAENVPE